MMKLLTEIPNSNIPLNYRYLSAYRILELRFKEGGYWTPEFEELMDRYSPKFLTIGVSGRALKAHIETFRNRCAHGRFRNSKADEPGITALDNDALLELQRFRQKGSR